MHRRHGPLPHATVVIALALLLCAAAAAQPAPAAPQFLTPDGPVPAEFLSGDYAAAAERLTALLEQDEATPQDCVWLGRAHHMLDDVAAEAESYRSGVELLETSLLLELGLHRPNIDPGPLSAEDAALVAQLLDQPDRQAAQDHAHRRAELMLQLARVQRGPLDDPRAAVETLRRALSLAAWPQRSVEELLAERERVLEAHLRLPGRPPAMEHGRRVLLHATAHLMRELALAQAQAGETAAAIETLSKLSLRRLTHGISDLPEELQLMARLIAKLPGDAEVPPTPVLAVLTPERPEVSFRLMDVADMARSHGYRLVGGQNPHWWYYAVAPAPGYALASVEVRQSGGEHDMYVAATSADEAERYIFLGNNSGRYEMPHEAGTLDVSMAPKPEDAKETVLTFRATFRPAGPMPPNPLALSHVQYEALPPGGTFTVDGRPIAAPVFSIKPGRHAVEYTAPAHPARFQAELELLPNRRHGLFINLDSPFTTHSTNLRDFDGHRWLHGEAKPTVARLPDGRWLLVRGHGWVHDRRALVTTSDDLAVWDEPRDLPGTGVFPAQAPSAYADDAGTVWVAYASERWGRRRPGATAVLWLTSTRDGRSWTPPWPFFAPESRGVLSEPPQFLRGPDGRHWLISRHHAAAAESLEDVRFLAPLATPFDSDRVFGGGAYAFDDAGRLHVVWGDPRGRHHSVSTDGQTFGPPATFHGHDGSAINLHLLVRGDRMALIDGQSLVRLRLIDGRPQWTEPIQLAFFLAPLHVGGVNPTPDGEVLLFAGQEHVWLLRATVEAVLGEETEPSATAPSETQPHEDE